MLVVTVLHEIYHIILYENLCREILIFCIDGCVLLFAESGCLEPNRGRSKKLYIGGEPRTARIVYFSIGLPAFKESVPDKGRIQGGGGPGGLFWGPPNFIKREKNVARMRAKTPRFST